VGCLRVYTLTVVGSNFANYQYNSWC